MRQHEEFWYRLLCGIVLFGVVGTLSIAFLSATPHPHGSPSQPGATIWVTAIAAAGTLGAIWAALRAVRDSGVQAAAAAREAREREEMLRHDAVRPVLLVRVKWWGEQAAGVIEIEVENWGLQTAVNLHVELRFEGHPEAEWTSQVTNIPPLALQDVSRPPKFPFRHESGYIGDGTDLVLIAIYKDVLDGFLSPEWKAGRAFALGGADGLKENQEELYNLAILSRDATAD